MKSVKELVVIDVETSGTNPFRHDVLAVAVVPVDKTRPTLTVCVSVETPEWADFARKNFERFRVEWEATRVPPAVACQRIEQFLATEFAGVDVTPVGHNVGFDIAFLKKLAFRGGRDALRGLSHRALDTHTLLFLLHLKGLIPQTALSSDGAFRHFEVRVDEAVRHTALGDAIATRELLLKVLSLL